MSRIIGRWFKSLLLAFDYLKHEQAAAWQVSVNYKSIILWNAFTAVTFKDLILVILEIIRLLSYYSSYEKVMCNFVYNNLYTVICPTCYKIYLNRQCVNFWITLSEHSESIWCYRRYARSIQKVVYILELYVFVWWWKWCILSFVIVKRPVSVVQLFILLLSGKWQRLKMFPLF